MRPPRQIGPYRIITLIGVGGSSTVYRAVRTADDVQVAIKVLADNHSAIAESRRRFTDERLLMARVDDPSIATIYDAGETDDGQPYMVLELANRGDLRSRVDELAQDGRRPDADDIRSVGRHLRNALTALHREGVVHRDLSPSNILIRGDSLGGKPPLVVDRPLLEPGERFLLGDLGFAKRLADGSGLTRGGGTEGFAAPEQRRAVSVVDRRADLYSATALVEWLATGTPLADRLTSFVARGTADDPVDRHPDVETWFRELEEALGPVRFPEPVRGRLGLGRWAKVGASSRRHRRWLVGAAVLSAPVLVVLADSALRPSAIDDASLSGSTSIAPSSPPSDPPLSVDLGPSAPASPSASADSSTSSATTTPSTIDPSISTTATIGTSSEPTTATSSVTLAPAATSTVTAAVTSAATSVATSTAPSTTDDFPFSPRAFIDSPSEGATIDRELIISGTARAPDGVERVELVVRNLDDFRYWHDDPGELQAEFIRFPVPVAPAGGTDTTWTYRIAPGELPPGSYRLRVWARDVNRTGDPVSDTITIEIESAG